MKTVGNVLGGASGQNTSKAAEEATAYGKRSEQAAKERQAQADKYTEAAAGQFGDLATRGTTMADKAAAQGAQYDTTIAQRLGESPESYMQRMNTAVGQQANQQALDTTNQATKSAIKGARTAGMLGGQAALAAAQHAGDTYAGSRQTALDSLRNIYGTQDTQQLQGNMQMSQNMAGREQAGAGIQATGAGGIAGIAGQQQGAANAYQGSAGAGYGTGVSGQAAAGQQAGGFINTIGNIGSNLFSDIRMKDEIEPADMSSALDKIRSYSYKYKGGDRPEAGIMAQDLEGGAMEPAVTEDPETGMKAIDARRLTTMNTAALSEHEKRLKDIEAIVSAIAQMGGAA